MSRLKKVSISLVLLSCFAITSKVGAMSNPNREFIDSQIKEVSIRGVQEGDLYWIISELNHNNLKIKDLELLIENGLKKYINYSVKLGFWWSDGEKKDIYTLLESAIRSNKPEMVKLLLSIGAMVNKDFLKTIDKRIKLYAMAESTEDFAPLRKSLQGWKNDAIEIKRLLLAEKDKKERIRSPRQAKYYDARTHCVN